MSWKVRMTTALRLHSLWLASAVGGKRADLSGTILLGYDLRGADLRSANLKGSVLSYVDMRWACLSMADLSDAILKSTNLRGADLRGANLRGADLSFVDLRGANLKDASLSLADLPNFQIAPEKGSFIAWKAVKGAILELLVPAWAYRTTSLTSRKIRVSQAKVVRAYPEQGYESQTFAGLFATEFRYTVGEYATADRFNDDIREECTHGIHCFITRKEAEEWV